MRIGISFDLEVIRYEIVLVTGSMFDAATSAPVWLTIHGTRESIINKYLEIAENEDFPFEPSNCDRFVFYDVDVGEVKNEKNHFDENSKFFFLRV